MNTLRTALRAVTPGHVGAFVASALLLATGLIGAFA